jgi:hypothetical protein|uniref:Uncharacterized protein n=1 Tax=Myoviridae sp. ctshb19 TaxID=2825194 RepID=A0A8S5UGK6_9CAUD|nr:MAG TPA: hypothetical protein [Myoviridae sp. ctshb19]
MKLTDLKRMLNLNTAEYESAIKKIQQAAMIDKEKFVDFRRDELPDPVYDKLVEDGYQIQHNKYLMWCYRVSGWAGPVERP